MNLGIFKKRGDVASKSKTKFLRGFCKKGMDTHSKQGGFEL